VSVGAPARRPARLARPSLHALVLWSISAVAIVFLVAPTVFVIVVAFGKARFVEFPPHGLTFKWFGDIGSTFWSAFWFSVEVAVVSTVVSLVIAVPAAYAIVRGRFAGRGVLDAFARAPLQVPYIVTGVAFLQFYRLILDHGGPQLSGTSLGLIAAHMIVTTPFALSAAIVGLAAFDAELETAAYGLGMGRLATFFRVTLPSIRPSLFAGAFFAFLISFDNVPVSLYLAGDHVTLPVLMFQTANTAPSPTLYAVSALVTAFSVVAVVLVNRFVGLRNAASAGRA
jgi:putative spermidine/putrescine transport system permease protein